MCDGEATPHTGDMGRREGPGIRLSMWDSKVIIFSRYVVKVIIPPTV